MSVFLSQSHSAIFSCRSSALDSRKRMYCANRAYFLPGPPRLFMYFLYRMGSQFCSLAGCLVYLQLLLYLTDHEGN